MNKKLKIVSAFIISLIVLITTTVYASNEDITLKKVKEDVCKIELGEDGEVIKKLVSVDNPKKEIILQVDVTNLRNEEEDIKPSEIFLVIDNSKSMSDNKLADGRTRKEAVFSAAKKLSEQILKQDKKAKIGVVSFSTNSDTNKEGTLEDANLIIKPTDKIEDVTAAIDSIQTTGIRTDIDAGVQVAKSNFSSDENLNKHLVLLTDGVPNTAVGGPTSTYSGEVKTKTKATLKSINDSNINLITVMTGVDSQYQPDPNGSTSQEAAGKSYKDLAEEIFGTQENPNYGLFFYVTDDEVEKTITEDVYKNVVTIRKNEIKNIVLVDYFPDVILANYNFEIIEKANVGTVTAEINTENNSITWNIETLSAGQTATFKYKLTLKDKFDEKIINVETPTNEKVDVTYTNVNGEEKTETSNVSPSVILNKDNTVAPVEIPQTGDNALIITFSILVLAALLGLGIVKYRKNNK